MKIHITGAHKYQRTAIKKIIPWALNVLTHGLKLETLKIIVDVYRLEHDRGGFCTWLDNNIKPREILVEFNRSPSSKTSFYKSVLHECVHVKQFYFGQLSQDIRSNSFKWKGKIVDDSVVSYRKLPWEKEAHRLEKSLYPKMIKELDLS